MDTLFLWEIRYFPMSFFIFQDHSSFSGMKEKTFGRDACLSEKKYVEKCKFSCYNTVKNWNWSMYMVAEVKSGMVYGIQGELITVQADISDGLPIFYLIGYLSGEVKEARDRVRTALKNTGFCLPPKRVAVNLAPADMRKAGTCFDLAIAVSLLIAMRMISGDVSEGILFLGELALDGALLSIDGVLPILYCARNHGYHKCVIPLDNVEEASLLGDMEIFGAKTLQDVFTQLTERRDEERIFAAIPAKEDSRMGRKDMDQSGVYGFPDFKDVKGQHMARRAIEIAVAGYHNLFLEGPPGAGKSMLASCIPGIMPEMTLEEKIDTTMIYSVKGLLNKGFFPPEQRPYRAPGHSISMAGMFGGGVIPKPGEVSLAHHGVLFLDEFTEYKKDIIEMFRIPLERHEIVLTRNSSPFLFPCDFILITAANPCPCGFYPDRRYCRCSERQIRQYQNKLSGPILDRMDLFVYCEKVSYQELTDQTEGEGSDSIRERIASAWKIQEKRFCGKSHRFNGRMDKTDVERFCQLDTPSRKLMERAFEAFHMTGRSYFRIIKTARTIADLEGEERILLCHLEEALLFRRAMDNRTN